MKFLRYGEPGQERPGLLHTDGTIRDLSAHIPDLAGAALTRLGDLAAVDATKLPEVSAKGDTGNSTAA